MPRDRSTPSADGEGREEVGYGRPPTRSRFKPGQSGNPSGRPKRKPPATDLGQLLAFELQKEIDVQEGGRTKKVPKAAVLVAQLVNQAVKGDRRAIENVFKLMASVDTSAGVNSIDMNAAMIANFLNRHGGGESAHD